MLGSELTFPGDPFGLGSRRVPPPSSIYITDDDTSLRIVTANSIAGVTVGLTGLRIDENNKPQPIDETHTPNTDRSAKTQDYRIGKGNLLRATAFVTAAAPLSGQTYVILQLIRGLTGPKKVITTLCAGYITAVQAIGFPGSPILSSLEAEPAIRWIQGTKPAAGVEITETVPTGARWEVMAILLQLQASGAAGTRFPDLRVRTGIGTVAQYLSNVGIGPGGLGLIQFGPNLPNITYAGFGYSTAGFPGRFLLRAADQFVTDTPGINAADQYEAPTYQVREWLEVA